MDALCPFLFTGFIPQCLPIWSSLCITYAEICRCTHQAEWCGEQYLSPFIIFLLSLPGGASVSTAAGEVSPIFCGHRDLPSLMDLLKGRMASSATGVASPTFWEAIVAALFSSVLTWGRLNSHRHWRCLACLLGSHRDLPSLMALVSFPRQHPSIHHCWRRGF